MRPFRRSDERGVALVFSLLLTFMVAGLAIGVILMMSGGNLIAKYNAAEATMESVADAGLEQGRDLLNGNANLLLGQSFVTLQNNVAVNDATGTPIPGMTRSIYAGLTGNTTGQYGVFASVISQVWDANRKAVVVRRMELSQESFARFARFDDRTVSSTVFAGGIQVFGPLHTNQRLYVGNGAFFRGPVTTASNIQSPGGSTFDQGYTENVPVIPLPTPADLATLQSYATTGNTNINGVAGVPLGTFTPSVRIEFVAVDINLDGVFTGANEGFMRVWRANNNTPAALEYVTARRPTGGTANDPNLQSINCGGTTDANANPLVRTEFVPWRTAADIYAATPGTLNDKADSVRSVYGRSPNRRCFLGGDQRLWNGNNGYDQFSATPAAPHNTGTWLKWPGYGAGNAPAVIGAAIMRSGRPVNDAAWPGNNGNQADYLWPINRGFNLNFKGVIYVSGAVAVSGELRGQVTVASTGNISLADDINYVTPPGSQPDCEADILGLLTPEFFMIEDNNVNSPFMSGLQNSPQFPQGVPNVPLGYRTGFDDSADEILNGSVLTLNSLASEDVGNGSDNSEQCIGAPVGRGCFRMAGSAIQGINAPRMSSSPGGYTGWNPQWSYDRCTAVKPPPYFPTTGRYYKNRFYEMDPVGFVPATWYANNQ